MKPSIFNFSYQRNKQEYVVYNTFSKAVIVLDESEYAKFNHIGHNHVVLDEEMYQILFENGLIISDGFCEIDYLRYFHYKTKFSNDELSLTIAPTLDCNFACPYCYENPRKGKMTEDIQEHLLAFIKQKERQGTKKLDITYGGEPLLYPEIIDSLATKINEYGLKKEMYVGMSLVTNGYLVTPDIVEMLLKNKIHSVQITLDGLEKHHNKRRFLRNGKGKLSIK